MSVDTLNSYRMTTDLGPAIGNGNVNQETVDLAVKDLVQSLAKPYETLLGDVSKKLAKGDYYARSTPYCIVDLPCGSLQNFLSLSMSIPNYLMDSIDLGEERYSVSLLGMISRLDETNPLEALVILLSKRISELGFPCNKVEVRFEKGCFDSNSQYWHRDGRNNHDIGISTCYSSKKNWSTRVLSLDKKNIYELFRNKDKGYIFDKNNGLPDQDALKEIEAASEIAKFGLLYDVQELLHRGPKEEDLINDKIATNDYRIFIRFNRDKK